jgi:hypothetical protein
MIERGWLELFVRGLSLPCITEWNVQRMQRVRVRVRVTGLQSN